MTTDACTIEPCEFCGAQLVKGACPACDADDDDDPLTAQELGRALGDAFAIADDIARTARRALKGFRRLNARVGGNARKGPLPR